MGRRKTHEEFMKDFMKKNKNAKNIEILGKYVNSRTKIKCRCKIDGYEWETKSDSLLNGYGCPKCAGTMKKTHEEFMKDFMEKNKSAKDIEILEEYKGSNKKIKCRCKIDGNIWYTTPNNLLSGYSCPKCRSKKQSKKQTLTHEEFMERFYKKNKNAENIEILGTYVNNKTKIKCKCKKDGYEWETTPNHLLSKGYGCPKCSGRIKLTHEEFLERFYVKNKNAENIEILEQYKGNAIKIKCKCKIDDNIFEMTPRDLLRNHGCPKCSNVYRRTHEEFIQEMKEINSDIEILGEYKGTNIKIKCRCKIDGYEWETKPKHLLKGYGCHKCGYNKLKDKKLKTHEEFIKDFMEKNIYAENIEILEEYKGEKAKIKCRCKIDGYEWETTAGHLLRGHGCHKCKNSKGEKRIIKYLDNKNIKYIHNETYFKNLKGVGNGILKPDFIIENKKVWIEFDGEQHFIPVDFANRGKKWAEKQFKINQENDRLKNEYAKKHNWKLIRIPYWDFDRIEEILDRELEEK